MGLSDAITSQLDQGITLLFKIMKWAVIVVVGLAIGWGIVWLLFRFGIMEWLLKGKKKEEKKQEEIKQNGITH